MILLSRHGAQGVASNINRHLVLPFYDQYAKILLPTKALLLAGLFLTLEGKELLLC